MNLFCPLSLNKLCQYCFNHDVELDVFVGGLATVNFVWARSQQPLGFKLGWDVPLGGVAVQYHNLTLVFTLVFHRVTLEMNFFQSCLLQELVM